MSAHHGRLFIGIIIAFFSLRETKLSAFPFFPIVGTSTGFIQVKQDGLEPYVSARTHSEYLQPTPQYGLGISFHRSFNHELDLTWRRGSITGKADYEAFRMSWNYRLLGSDAFKVLAGAGYAIRNIDFGPSGRTGLYNRNDTRGPDLSLRISFRLTKSLAIESEGVWASPRLNRGNKNTGYVLYSLVGAVIHPPDPIVSLEMGEILFFIRYDTGE